MQINQSDLSMLLRRCRLILDVGVDSARNAFCRGSGRCTGRYHRFRSIGDRFRKGGKLDLDPEIGVMCETSEMT